MNLLCNQSFASRDVGDKYLTFHSLDAKNLLSTEVRYNYPVLFDILKFSLHSSGITMSDTKLLTWNRVSLNNWTVWFADGIQELHSRSEEMDFLQNQKDYIQLVQSNHVRSKNKKNNH